jgi:hypothetical protein
MDDVSSPWPPRAPAARSRSGAAGKVGRIVAGGAVLGLAGGLSGCASYVEHMAEERHVWHYYPTALVSGTVAAPGLLVDLLVQGVSGGAAGGEGSVTRQALTAPAAIAGFAVHTAFFTVGYPLEFVVPGSPPKVPVPDAPRAEPLILVPAPAPAPPPDRDVPGARGGG